MGRAGTGLFRTPKAMREAWEAYKLKCDSNSVLTHEFSARNSEFVSKELVKPVTYTIQGFALFCGMTKQNFFATYSKNPKFDLVIARIEEECELDARKKFETGQLPTQLAGLWMSHYGYTTKQDTSVTGAVPVVISGGEALED